MISHVHVAHHIVCRDEELLVELHYVTATHHGMALWYHHGWACAAEACSNHPCTTHPVHMQHLL
jgi:hypothetical protein